MALETPVCEFGLPAVDFSLPGTDGKIWTLEDCRGENGLLVMFICNHCPYVILLKEAFQQFSQEYQRFGALDFTSFLSKFLR